MIKLQPDNSHISSRFVAMTRSAGATAGEAEIRRDSVAAEVLCGRDSNVHWQLDDIGRAIGKAGDTTTLGARNSVSEFACHARATLANQERDAVLGNRPIATALNMFIDSALSVFPKAAYVCNYQPLNAAWTETDPHGAVHYHAPTTNYGGNFMLDVCDKSTGDKQGMLFVGSTHNSMFSYLHCGELEPHTPAYPSVAGLAGEGREAELKARFGSDALLSMDDPRVTMLLDSRIDNAGKLEKLGPQWRSDGPGYSYTLGDGKMGQWIYVNCGVRLDSSWGEGQLRQGLRISYDTL